MAVKKGTAAADAGSGRARRTGSVGGTRKGRPARKTVAQDAPEPRTARTGGAKPVAAAKAAAKKAAPSSAPATNAATKRAATQKPTTKKAATQKAATQKAATTKAATKKAATKKAATKKAAPKKAATKKAATKTGASKTARRARPAGTGGANALNGTARALPVREDEAPWTTAELGGLRAELEADIARLELEIDEARVELVGLMQDAGDGAGEDQADAGTKTFEREHEMSVANNSRLMLEQSQHALERIAGKTYGTCESCGNPIGKLRLQAFPRATLCVSCKQKQERR